MTSAVIVNFRTKELTAEAARSVLAELTTGEVVIVDNASDDDSIAYLRTLFPEPTVRVVEAPMNLGFGRAVNLVMPTLVGDLILLLNSDAVLLPGALGKLADVLLADPSVGVVAPAVFDADGVTPQPGTYGAFPRPIRRSARAGATCAPDWVSGVAMLMRRDEFVAVGGFDPAFDMYLEDVDLCRRLRAEGRFVRRETSASVLHLGGRSWGSSVEKRRHYQRSKLTYFKKQGVHPAGIACLRILSEVRIAVARIPPLPGRCG